MNTAPKLSELIKTELRLARDIDDGCNRITALIESLAPPSGEGVDTDLQRDLDWLAAHEGGTANLCFMAEALNAEGQHGRSQAVHAANDFIDKQEKVIRTLLAGQDACLRCPECHNTSLLYECVACSHTNYPATQQSAPEDGDAEELAEWRAMFQAFAVQGLQNLGDADLPKLWPCSWRQDVAMVAYALHRASTTPPPASQEMAELPESEGVMTWTRSAGVCINPEPGYTAEQMHEHRNTHVTSQESGGRWMHISTAPKDGARLLLALTNGAVVIGRWTEDDAKHPVGPTHWQHLPSPPSSAAETNPACPVHCVRPYGKICTCYIATDRVQQAVAEAIENGTDPYLAGIAAKTDAAEQAKPEMGIEQAFFSEEMDAEVMAAEQAQAGEVPEFVRLKKLADELESKRDHFPAAVSWAEEFRIAAIMAESSILRRLAGGVTVDYPMVHLALNAQPYLDKNDAMRVWQLFKDGVDSETAMRAALVAALGAKP